MAKPRPLKRPPIVEALVDLQASVPGGPEVFKALADELKHEFPNKEELRNFEAKIEIKDGKVVPPRVDDVAFGGIRLANVDRTIYVQFRPNGFTLSNLKVYMGGDKFIDKGMTLWELLVGTIHKALHGDEFTRYLTSAPDLPAGAPQQVSQFLSRIVGHDAQRQASAVVSQQLQEQQPGKSIAVTVDVDVFRTGHFPVDSTALREVLGSLRMLKNETFFSLLTEETVSLYE